MKSRWIFKRYFRTAQIQIDGIGDKVQMKSGYLGSRNEAPGCGFNSDIWAGVHSAVATNEYKYYFENHLPYCIVKQK